MPGRTLASLSIHAPLVGGGDSHLCLSESGFILDSLLLCYKGARCVPQELACERRIRWEKW